jgi:flagellar motor switch/type III secretory pathway protein FliN
MTVSEWSPPRSMSRVVADIRNFYAVAPTLTPVAALIQDARTPIFSLEDPLPRYSLVCTCACSYGTCLVGLDVGAISPAYASDTVHQVARDPSAIREWLDWLITPWMGPIERYLGVTLSLVQGDLDAVFPWNSVAFCIDVDGKRGHVAIAGEGLERLPWQQLFEGERIASSPMHVWVEIHALMSAGTFPLREIRKLTQGGMLRFAELKYQLHVGALKSGIRLDMTCVKEGSKMNALTCEDADRWNVVTLERSREHGAMGLEDIGLTVEILLDQRLASLAEVERIRKGSVYTIPAAEAGRSVSLCCNGRVFARGELVSVDGQLGVLISESIGGVA